MFTNLLPVEAAHTTLGLYEKQTLLVIFYHAFPKKFGPSYSPDGAMVEFEVMGGRKNFVDLQNLLLEIKRRISRNNDGDEDRHWYCKYRRAILRQQLTTFFIFRMHCNC